MPDVPNWAVPASRIIIAATGLILLLVRQRWSSPGGEWALAGLMLLILGRFWPLKAVTLPLRLAEAGMSLQQISQILFFWSLLYAILGLAAFLCLAIGLWQGGLLGRAAVWRLKGQGRPLAVVWAWRGILLLILTVLVSLGTSISPSLLLNSNLNPSVPPYVILGGFLDLAGIGRTLLDALGLLYLVGALILGVKARDEVKTGEAGAELQASFAAGLVHLGVLLSLVGALVAMAVSVLQRGEHPHLAQHARQAFAFQAGVILVDAAAALLLAVIYSVLVLQALPLRLVTVLAGGMLGLFHLTTLVLALYAAWQAWQGRPFSYPFFTVQQEQVER